MSDQKVADLMREFVRALVERNVEKALSFFAEDATYMTPEGTFKGKNEVKRYLAWMAKTNSNLTISETGIGIVVEGDKAVYEHILEGTFQGMRWRMPATCVYEFSGDKITKLRTFYDRLSLAKQAAKGWSATRAVNAVIAATEKGLR